MPEIFYHIKCAKDSGVATGVAWGLVTLVLSPTPKYGSQNNDRNNNNVGMEREME